MLEAGWAAAAGVVAAPVVVVVEAGAGCGHRLKPDYLRRRPCMRPAPRQTRSPPVRSKNRVGRKILAPPSTFPFQFFTAPAVQPEMTHR